MDDNLSDRISLLHIRRDAIEVFKQIDLLESKLSECVAVLNEVKTIIDRGNVIIDEVHTVRIYDRLLMIKEQSIDIFAITNAMHIDISRKAGV